MVDALAHVLLFYFLVFVVGSYCCKTWKL